LNSIVSVSERKDPDFTIYPIPADKQLNVSFGENITGKVRLIISDLTGRVVYSEAINDARPGQVQPINSQGFKDGMYLLQVSSGGNTVTRKIVIKQLRRRLVSFGWRMQLVGIEQLLDI
jgi:hypothetical protein